MRFFPRWLLVGLAIMASVMHVQAALKVDLDDRESIKHAAAQVAEDMLTFYEGNKPGKIPGILPGPPPAGPYYWWIGGAMWGTLLDYRHATGDKKYDDITMKAMTWQATTPNKDFMGSNWTSSMGNDDQAFWAFAALLATETGFTDPPAKDELDWLALAQAVFNEQTLVERRVEKGNCKWGLRWQANSLNNGWDYINTIANACYFNIGARLARYTKNDTYAELADKTFEWLTDHGYIDKKSGEVYDGAHEPNECMDINKQQFSYNPALLIQGAAFLYDYTEGSEKQQVWKSRIDMLLDNMLDRFFRDGIAFESQCEATRSCTVDMETFKGYVHRWLTSTTLMAPYTADKILPVLRTSTAAAVSKCNGGNNGRMCAFMWGPNDTDLPTDEPAQAAHQMNVLAALTGLLMKPEMAPVTNETGGTSKGNPNAGVPVSNQVQFADITTADRVGAAFVTVVFCLGMMVIFAWIGI